LNVLATDVRIEWDAFPDPPKRRRKPRAERIQILEPDDPPKSRIHRVEITVHRRRQHHQQIPPWVIAMVIFAALCWISPFGMVIALVMGGILVTAHPTIGIALGVMLALVIIIAMRERLADREF
jgi:hypothetical protein